MTEAKTAACASDWARMSLSDRALLQYEVEQFLYEEAALLDARRYRDWLALIADDVHYWMPIRRTVTISDLDREFTKPGDMAFFDDDRELLESEVDSWVGRRTDVLRREGGGFRIVKRHLFLDQTLIRATNMSTLF